MFMDMYLYLWICICIGETTVSVMYVFGLLGTSVVIIVIYMHIFRLTVVQVAGTPTTALRRTYPIGACLMPFKFRGSIVVR